MPPSLFRYYPANLQALENVKRQCFYFGSVADFNDPFECHILPPAAKDDDNSFDAVRDHYTRDPEIPAEIRAQLEQMDVKSLRELIKKIAIDSLARTREDFVVRRGVTCFSERNENLLMWSHYASGGTGLCLEFDTTSEVFQKARKVQYRETPPEIDALEIMLHALKHHDASWIEKLYCTKPMDWRYEQEWRVIHVERGTVYHYPRECLKAVYFGPRCAFHFIETVCLILQGQNQGVSFWRGSMSHTRYAVEFTPFTYTPAADVPRT